MIINLQLTSSLRNSFILKEHTGHLRIFEVGSLVVKEWFHCCHGCFCSYFVVSVLFNFVLFCYFCLFVSVFGDYSHNI